MFDLLSTLIKGTNAKAVETATDIFAIDLITQKIREAEAGVNNAKQALASLIMRQRAEQKALGMLRSRKATMEDRVRQALAAGNEVLAMDGATALATMENEQAVRAETVARIDERVERLRQSVERAHRRVVDLRQGAVTARAIDLERKSQKRVNAALGTSAIEEAEALIRRVADQDDPLAQSEIIAEIDNSLSHKTTEDKLADAGFGPATKVRPEDILARLRTTPTASNFA
ncbi:MAG: PspA/IM30 family protein [Devosia sp.]